MSSQKCDIDAVEQKAKELYASVQHDTVPERFRRPENFATSEVQAKTQTLKAAPAPSAASLMYKTSNGEYGTFEPSIIEMPVTWRAKTQDLIDMQNGVVYRSDGVNTSMDKERFMDPYVTIRRK